jgi:hypothetical protein
MNTVENTGYLRQKKAMRKEINLPKTVFQLLEKKALAEGRSLKNYIEFILLQHVQIDPSKIRDKKVHD